MAGDGTGGGGRRSWRCWQWGCSAPAYVVTGRPDGGRVRAPPPTCRSRVRRGRLQRRDRGREVRDPVARQVERHAAAVLPRLPHGAAGPAGFAPVSTEPDPARVVGRAGGIGKALLAEGYALAGSAYASNGWAVADGVAAGEDCTRSSATRSACPTGCTPGAIARRACHRELAERHPEWVSGAAPLCGVLGGPNPNLDLALDLAYAVRSGLAGPQAGRIRQLRGRSTQPAGRGPARGRRGARHGRDRRSGGPVHRRPGRRTRADPDVRRSHAAIAAQGRGRGCPDGAGVRHLRPVRHRAAGGWQPQPERHDRLLPAADRRRPAPRRRTEPGRHRSLRGTPRRRHARHRRSGGPAAGRAARRPRRARLPSTRC